MRHVFYTIVAVFTLISLPLISHADVWVPPWGESLCDSTLITVNYSDTAIDVTILTRMAARKFVSDDYLLTWTRNDSGGYFDHQFTEGSFTDSIIGLDDDNRFATRLTGISRCLLEDTTTFSLTTRLHYPHNDQFQAPQWMEYRQTLMGHTDDPAWGGWGMVFEESVPWHFRVVSNQEVTAWADNGGGVQSGSDISFEGETGWDMAFGAGVFINPAESYHDFVEDTVTYALTPEVRMATPGIILDEDVRIYISYADQGAWHYMQHADITLNAGLACFLAPMYLWYPNDETDARVRLQGFRLSGAWGHDNEIWQDDSAEVHEVRQGGQNGFFIKIPSLDCHYQTPNGYWRWTDVRLRVDIDQPIDSVETTRFILITAPLDYSRITFAITNGWDVGFVRWNNPFDDIEVGNTWLRMQGICAEPGVAQVWWGPVTVGYEPVPPAEFTITSVAPNPFNSRTSLNYTLPKASEVRLTVIDMNGRIQHQEQLPGDAGVNTISLDASNLPAGIYLAELGSEGKVLRVKMVCVK
jgi:hypothetical protein